jgi:hypothetical protein
LWPRRWCSHRRKSAPSGRHDTRKSRYRCSRISATRQARLQSATRTANLWGSSLWTSPVATSKDTCARPRNGSTNG